MASQRATFQVDPRGMRQLVNSAPVGAAAERAAQQGLANAQASAPRRSGRFASSFTVKRVTVQAGNRGESRAGAVIENSAAYAAYVHRSKTAQNFMNSIVPHINRLSGR